MATFRGEISKIRETDDSARYWNSRSLSSSFVTTAELTSVGQLHLKSSSVLIIGAGGLGCPAAAYIAGAGVGRIRLVDGDTVVVSNLYRQVIHSSNTVGMRKVDSAICYLKSFVALTLAQISYVLLSYPSLNPNVTYVSHPEHISPQSVREIVGRYDLVLDCTRLH